ncbi:MAG: oligosaccharide flippase family protein [Mucinivorans sp.]
MTQHSQLVKNTTIYALGDIVPRLLSFISFPILTTYLLPLDYGIISYVNTINTFLMVASFMCVNTYYLVYYYKQDSPQKQRELLGNLSIFVLLLNVLIALMLFLLGKPFFGLIEGNIDFFPYIAIGVATNFFGTFAVLPSALYRLLERPIVLVSLNIARGVIALALTMILVICYDYTALGVLYANLVVNFLFAIIFGAITWRKALFAFNWTQIRSALRFSLPLVPGSIAYYLISMSDRILIDKYLSPTELGIYSTAATLALLLNIVSYGAYKAFEPHIFKTFSDTDFNIGFRKIRDGLLVIYLMGAMCLAVFAEEFFDIFAAAEYHTAYIYVAPIVVGVFLSSMMMLYSTVITARGKTFTNSMLTIVGGALSITLNNYLLPVMGLFGACAVSATTYFLMYMATIYFSKISISQLFPLISLLVVALVTYFTVYVLSIDSIVYSILVKSAIVLLTLCVVALLMRVNIVKFLGSLFKKS